MFSQLISRFVGEPQDWTGTVRASLKRRTPGTRRCRCRGLTAPVVEGGLSSMAKTGEIICGDVEGEVRMELCMTELLQMPDAPDA